MLNKQVEVIVRLLEDMKSEDITVIDVSAKTAEIDTMIIVTGTSNRHLQGILNHLKDGTKANKQFKTFNVEGADSDWILIDLQSILIHIMSKDARQYYQLETLWIEK